MYHVGQAPLSHGSRRSSFSWRESCFRPGADASEDVGGHLLRQELVSGTLERRGVCITVGRGGVSAWRRGEVGPLPRSARPSVCPGICREQRFEDELGSGCLKSQERLQIHLPSPLPSSDSGSVPQTLELLMKTAATAGKHRGASAWVKGNRHISDPT